jgi:chemotaxis protein MotA
MVGTLVGLMMMLQDMSDPNMLGPNMAVAIITTFYGSMVANYIALPIHNKLKLYSAEEILVKEVLVEGILSIQNGENPRIIEEKLRAFLSPTLRESMSTSDEGDRRSGEE